MGQVSLCCYIYISSLQNFAHLFKQEAAVFPFLHSAMLMEQIEACSQPQRCKSLHEQPDEPGNHDHAKRFVNDDEVDNQCSIVTIWSAFPQWSPLTFLSPSSSPLLGPLHALTNEPRFSRFVPRRLFTINTPERTNLLKGHQNSTSTLKSVRPQGKQRVTGSWTTLKTQDASQVECQCWLPNPHVWFFGPKLYRELRSRYPRQYSVDVVLWAEILS